VPNDLTRPLRDISGTSMSRRAMLTTLGFGAGALALGLSGCAPAGSGVTTIRFFQTKPEVVGYFDDLIARFHDSQSKVRVVHDSTSLIAPQFVRGNPPDLACYNYNLENARYVERGVLTDLSDMPEASRIADSVQALVDQYGTYPGRTSVLPYSITAAATIYNKEIFEANGVEIPTTWSELIAACETFQAAGVTPIYGTYKDTWTTAQGVFDYTTGGAIDVDGFYEKLFDEGADVSATSPVSFEKDFSGAVEKMVQLSAFTNQDAPSRGYADGNLAFAQGEAAMYFQGPWALGEIAKTSPDLGIGTFPLPMTEDPDDLKVRVNLDLGLWIPTTSTKVDAAREFLTFLMSPEIMDTYNADNLAFGVTKDAPPVTDPRITNLQQYIDDGAFYQGAQTYIPNSIPVGNYIQSTLLGDAPDRMLKTLDSDWRRLAQRS
jgi:raffinose/stachyose/melibiose transport system substrate-binding protein